jgi:hypothetical protein
MLAMQGGTFVLEMGGVRWAVDLGGDSYGLKGYWTQASTPGARYSFYRKSTRGHNTLTFFGNDADPGPSNQAVEAMTNISSFDSGERTAVVNLTDAYSGSVASASRTFTVSADYTQVVISDSIKALPGVPTAGADADAALTWSMHTYANITIDGDGRGATLMQRGQVLRATLSASTGAGRFSAVDMDIASLPSNQSTAFDKSPGLRKLVYDTSVIGDIEVTLQLQKS